jgi:hypothetical protein
MGCPFRLIYGENATLDGMELREIYDTDILEIPCCECGNVVFNCYDVYCSLRKKDDKEYWKCVGEDKCSIYKGE